MTEKRPMVNVYELDGEGVEQLVYREMNDAEFSEYQAREEAFLNAPKPEHPIVAAARTLSAEDRALLRQILLGEIE